MVAIYIGFSTLVLHPKKETKHKSSFHLFDTLVPSPFFLSLVSLALSLSLCACTPFLDYTRTNMFSNLTLKNFCH